MKEEAKLLMWAFFIICTFSCTSRKKKDAVNLDRIEHIWDLSDYNIETATKECSTIQNDIYTSSEYVRMKYDLLCIRIRDKNYMTPSSPDSIKKVTTYMEKNGSSKDIMRAYYYMSSVYDDLHDSPRAVEYSLKSLAFISQPQSCDTAIALKGYSQLSAIYRSQNNIQEALDMALDGLSLAEKSGLVNCWYIMDVATAYNKIGDTGKCLEYCIKAYYRLREEKDYKRNLPVASEMMYIFAQQGEFGKVDTLEAILKTIPGHKQSYNYNFAKAIVHEARGEIDSAITYYIHDLNYSSLWEKQFSLSHLFSIYRKREDYERATVYALQYQDNTKAMNEAEQREWVRNAKGMYDYQRDKEREEALARENAAMRFWGAMGLCILLIIIVSLIAIYNYHKKKVLEETVGKEQEMAELQAQLRAKTDEIHDKELSLKIMEQRANELGIALNRKRDEISKLVRMSSMDTTRICKPDIAMRLEKAAREGKAMSEDDWLTLSSSIDAEELTFRTTIMEHMPHAKDITIRTAYLVKIGMTNQQIEILTGSPHQTAWNRIKKIKDALGTKLQPQGEQ